MVTFNNVKDCVALIKSTYVKSHFIPDSIHWLICGKYYKEADAYFLKKRRLQTPKLLYKDCIEVKFLCNSIFDSMSNHYIILRKIAAIPMSMQKIKLKIIADGTGLIYADEITVDADILRFSDDNLGIKIDIDKIPLVFYKRSSNGIEFCFRSVKIYAQECDDN